MALTPDDVVNKRFQPTKFREGYDQDEVDDFLDEVVEELRRLNDENAELRRQMAECQEGNVVPAPVSATSETAEAEVEAPEAETPEVEETVEAAPVEETPEVEQPAVPVAAAAETSAPVAPAASTGSADQAAGVLQMAQRLHDEYVTQGANERDRIISEAQAKAQSLVSDAEAAAKKTTEDAEDTKRRTLDDLAEKKTKLEGEIEDLKSFETSYRERLRTYIADQLSDLDGQTPVAEQI